MSTRPRWQTPAIWPLIGLLVLALVNLYVHPDFFRLTTQHGHIFGGPIDVLNEGARALIVALGMTLVIATGGVDLSVGSSMAVGGAVAAVMLHAGYSAASALSAALGSGMVIGLINGVLIAGAGVQPIVMTLITMVAARGMAQLLTGGEVMNIKNATFEFLGNGYLAGFPFAPLLTIALFIATNFLLRKSALGLFIEAVGDNPVAARFAGVAAGRVKVGAYVFSGFCAALGGAMASANVAAADSYNLGQNMELNAIFAVVVGGTALSGGRFYLLGSFVGALLLQLLTQTMYYVGVPPAVAPVPKALLILFVCLAQSSRVRNWVLRFGKSNRSGVIAG